MWGCGLGTTPQLCVGVCPQATGRRPCGREGLGSRREGGRSYTESTSRHAASSPPPYTPCRPTPRHAPGHCEGKQATSSPLSTLFRLTPRPAPHSLSPSNTLQANTKACPKCSKPVEKNGGCNHVTCKCGQVCVDRYKGTQPSLQKPPSPYTSPETAQAGAHRHFSPPLPSPPPCSTAGTVARPLERPIPAPFPPFPSPPMQHFCWHCGQATGKAHTYTSISEHSCGRYKEEVRSSRAVQSPSFR